MTRSDLHSIHGAIAILRRHGVKLGDQQTRRLEWLSHAVGPLAIWNGERPSAGGRYTIVVIDPPTGAGAELLFGAMKSGDAIVIPFGENPAFDFLKSKFTECGTVGVSADGPHLLWWGGIDRSSSSGAAAKPAMRIVSCHPSRVGDLHVYHLRRSLERLGLAFDIEAIDGQDRLTAADKSAFLARMWRRSREPLLYVDPDVMFQAVPDLPQLASCDFAVHKWNGWEMSARTLYFGRSVAAEALLATWHDIATSYPDVWDGYVIDQAWSAVTSQMALDTVWLPRSYHAVAGEADMRRATIVHNLPPTGMDRGADADFAVRARLPRRAGRAGATDSLLVITSEAASDQAVTVVLRDEGSPARDTAASLQALTTAFARDNGGFCRLEVSLCAWQDDVRIVRDAARRSDNNLIEIAPGQTLRPDLFRALAANARSQPFNLVTDRP